MKKGHVNANLPSLSYKVTRMKYYLGEKKREREGPLILFLKLFLTPPHIVTPKKKSLGK